MKVYAGLNTPEVLQWAEERLGYPTGTFDPASARAVVGLDDDFEPIVVTILDRWSGSNCEATIVSDGTKRWASRRYISAVYRYVFERCGMNRMTMVTAVDNTAALRMHDALHHVHEGTHRDWFGINKDAKSYGFTRDDWERSPWFRKDEV